MPKESKGKNDFFKNIKLGDHICSIYKNKEEQFSVVTPFISSGLMKNERCIYIVDDNSKKDVILELERRGIDVKKYIKSKQFKILTKLETYLKDGYFDPDEMIAFLKETEKAVLKEGYSGLRVTGEMTWVLQKMKGSDRLIEYEAKLNDFFPNSKTTAICQYNEKRFNPEILIGVLQTHPHLVIFGETYKKNRYYSPGLYKGGAHNLLPKNVYPMLRDDIISKY